MKVVAKLIPSFAVACFASIAGAQLQHEYLLNESGGSIAYDSVGSVNGVVGPNTTLGGGFATFNPSSPFDTQSYIDWGTGIGQFGTSNFGISFNIDTTSTNYNNDLIGNRADGSFGNYISVRMLGDGEVAAEICQDGSGTNYDSVVSSASVNDGSWHNVQVWRMGTDLSLIIDGVLQGSNMGAGVADISNGNDFQAGYSPVAPAYGLAFTGEMSDVKIYEAVPEPAPFVALGLGVLPLLARRRKPRA